MRKAPPDDGGRRSTINMRASIDAFTPRLLVRQWRASDRAAFAAINTDPEVTRYFPRLLSPESSDSSIDICRDALAEKRWGNWAVEIAGNGEFIGFVGTSVPRRQFSFMPCVEVGYRLAKAHWHKSYATKAARAALKVGFEEVGLQEIVSFTAVTNLPSRAVMERLGMSTNAAEDFDHPAMEEGSPGRRHCIYRLPRAQWRA